MNQKISAEEFYEKIINLNYIDVRSPAEWERGHIPGSVNLPLFNNEERAEVGTIYKNSGKRWAVLRGLEIIGPKMAHFAKEAIKLGTHNELLIHCWRGGMRSESMAWLFNKVGIKTYTLDGGYKAYRNFVQSNFAKPAKLIVLGGMTGSGKTKVLRELEKKGEQVLDLEGIAHHKGSAFGALGEISQPSIEQFENELFYKWWTFDFSKPIWLEDESRFIGKDKIPEELWKQMRQTTVVKLNIPWELRVQNLLEDYGTFDKNLLKASIDKIHKRLGDLNYRKAIDALESNDLKTTAEISLNYYDKAYNFGLSKREGQSILEFNAQTNKAPEIAQKMLSFAKDL